jgi:hypothetical protein
MGPEIDRIRRELDPVGRMIRIARGESVLSEGPLFDMLDRKYQYEYTMALANKVLTAEAQCGSLEGSGDSLSNLLAELDPKFKEAQENARTQRVNNPQSEMVNGVRVVDAVCKEL